MDKTAKPKGKGGRRTDLDWEAIETDYRISQLSIRQIATKHGTEASSITRKAKKHSWVRDLSAAVRVATKAKVRAAVIEETQRNATECTQHVFSEVDKAANANTAVIVGHQRRAGRLSGLFEKIATELEFVTDAPAEIKTLIVSLAEVDPEAAAKIQQLASLTSRNNNLKTLSETLDRLTKIERMAYGLDEKENTPAATIDELIKAIDEEHRAKSE